MWMGVSLSILTESISWDIRGLAGGGGQDSGAGPHEYNGEVNVYTASASCTM